MRTASAAVVADARAGDPEAFGEIVRRHQASVFGIALARVRDFHEAEDIAQAVFVEAFLHLDRLDDDANLGPWLRTMAIHRSIDRLRRRRVFVDVDDVADDPALAEVPEALTEEGQLRERVLDAIGLLGRAQRETVTLHYLAGHSVAEIAALQGSPVGTVKARLHHARKRLKQEMMEMVETTLRAEAPGEDLAQQVYEVLKHPERHSFDTFGQLRRLGAGQVTAGFERAADDDAAGTRRMATNLAAQFAPGTDHERSLALVERALADDNREVRATAIQAALDHLPCSDALRRTRLVPVVVGLLADRSAEVRARAARALQSWVEDVPIEAAARALLEESNGTTRKHMEQLLRAVLDHRQAGVSPDRRPAVDERLARWQEDLESPSPSVRVRALMAMPIPPNDRRRSRQVVRRAVEMLKDPSRRVRQRAAYELWRWAADVPEDAVREALATETNERVKENLAFLLQRTAEQATG